MTSLKAQNHRRPLLLNRQQAE